MLIFKKYRFLSAFICLIVVLNMIVLADDEDLLDENATADDYQPVFSSEVVETSFYDDIVYDNVLLSDIKDSEYKYEINVLSQLGFIINDSNEFYPSANITKGEFIASVMNVVGNSLSSAEDKEYFKDVPKDSKYYLCTLNALNLGITKGSDSSYFGVDDTLSYIDAVTMLMRAAGYTVYAEQNGGYPVGYISAARISGLLKKSSFADIDVLSKEQAADLIYNFLCIQMFDIVSIGNSSVNYDRNQTVLEHFKKMYITSGTIDSNFISSLWDKNLTSNNCVTIDGEKYNVPEKKYAEYLGYPVDCYYTEENNSYGKKAALIVEQKDIEKLELKADDILEFSNSTYKYANNKKATVASIHTLIVNGIVKKIYNNSDFVPQNGTVTLISDGSSDYNTIIVNTYHSFVLSECTPVDKDKMIFNSYYNLPSFELDLSDESKYVSAYLNNDKIKIYIDTQNYWDADGYNLESHRIPKLPKNSIVNVFADKYDFENGVYIVSKDAKYVKLVITDSSVNGNCTELSDDYIYIDNNKFTRSDESYFSYSAEVFGVNCKGDFLFDYDGNICAVIVPDENKQLQYGYLIATHIDSSIDPKLQLKIMNADGLINVYEAEVGFKINDVKYKDFDLANAKLQESAKYLNSSFTISQTVKYLINSNKKLSKLETVLQSIGLPGGADTQHLQRYCERQSLFSRSENKYGLYVSKGSYAGLLQYNGPAKKYFKVPQTETFNDDDYSVFTTWEPSKTEKEVEVYDCNAYRVPNLVVQYYKPDSLYSYPYVLVGSVSHGLDDEGCNVSILNCCDVDGDNKYYSKDDDFFNALKCGDFIRIYGDNKYITKYDVICTVDDAKNFDRNKKPAIGFSKKTNDVDGEYTGCFYELYAVNDGTNLILQLGNIGENSMREYTQLNLYASNAVWGVFLYDATSKKPTVSSLFNPHVMDQAMQVGNTDATLVRIYESGTVTKFIVAYKGLK